MAEPLAPVSFLLGAEPTWPGSEPDPAEMPFAVGR